MVLERADWSLYQKLLKGAEEQRLRITYDEGRLEIMSPLPEHEQIKWLVHDLIRMLTLDLNIEMKCLGSTTFKDVRLQKGVEPDDCYYFKNAHRLRGRKRLNPKKDPPPELVFEVDITWSSVPRQPIYAAMGVVELWRWDGRKLQCLELADGKYKPREKSLAFPFLAPADLSRFIQMLPGSDDDNQILRKFRNWVRKNGWDKQSI